ncbi:MAG: cache domain-containing protein [Methanolinea sp.]|jgi:hypothetical protein|nr:cache domain-containing protein [Methanolinea sp.]
MNACIAVILVALVLVTLGCTTTRESVESSDTPMNRTLEQAVGAINAELVSVRTVNLASAERLSPVGLSGKEAESVLSEKLISLPWAISSVTISSDGIIAAAVPATFRDIVGRDVNYQDAVRDALETKAPRVSGVFMMEEGFAGISQSAPVFSPAGIYVGYTDVTYRPETLIGRAVEPVIAGSPYDIWVVQKDGRVIYDTTQEEIGRNLFSDPAYQSPELQVFFSRVVSEPEGRGVYRFWDRNWDRVITKEAVWATAGIDGAEWRVVLTTSGEEAVPAGGKPLTNATFPNMSGLDAFVRDAASFAREAGKDGALREFNDQKGRFCEGERYIFSYDMNGTVLALPYQQGLVGENRIDVRDANGVEYIRAMVTLASRGGGHTYYVYPNPSAGFSEQLKLSSVLPVDNEWFVGSGEYLPQVDAGFSQKERDQLVQRVKKARDFAQQQGKEAALAAFNDLYGPWADGAGYIFAYGLNGTTLALPNQPELIGTNRLGFLDHYGIAAVGWECDVAAGGGGFVYVVYQNPETGNEALKLCYVLPVDREWFVGSGIYSTSV